MKGGACYLTHVTQLNWDSLTRKITNSIEEAISELSETKTNPVWLERDLDLPFSKLTGDEFEVLCFLLLKSKHPNDRIYYYGKTSDMGRDIVHVLPSGDVRLIQCKNYAVNVDKSKIGAEMAKVYANVHAQKIPEQPDEVVFFVSKDLSANAKDLIQYQQKWLESANTYIETHLRSKPPEDLLDFAREWWPFGDSQSGISITSDVKKFHDILIEDFFSVKKVVDASRDEIRQDFREEIGAAFKEFSISQTANSKTVVTENLPQPTDVQASFLAASKSLLNWPQKLGDKQWIDRPEACLILGEITGDDVVEGRALLGAPGSGKSALLANLAHRLQEAGISFLAIKADTLGVNVDSIGKLSEQLRLPANLLDCAKSLASKNKLVVLVDQLDALSDLCDLRSERLNVLLDCINRLSLIPNVCVVASCRGFEFRHDARFRTIDLQELKLTLPAWETISELLKQQGIDGTNWPNSFSEILRIPQNLKVFLELLKGGTEHQVFDSYQGMLEELWNQKVTKSPDAKEKCDLLDRISETMSKKEEMWLPAINFEGQQSTVSQLVGDGIIKLSENRLKLGFRHQTLFSHARARAFVRGGLDLFDFVVARQHALFVRPTLWSTLGYLREASREQYQRQMEKLCNGNLRLHIQHLLLDFLGRLNDPEDFEEVWLIQWLEHGDYRIRAIRAISGSKGWFERLRDTQLVALMCNPKDIEWPLTSLLRESVNHSRDLAIELIKKYWITETEFDAFTFHVFDHFDHWDLETVELICELVARMEIDEVYVSGIASQVSVSQPELAPKILAVEFSKTLNRLKQEADPPVKELPADATMEDRWVEQLAHDPKRRFCALLESSSGRYDFPAIAEAAPSDFLSEIWPLFVDGVQQTIDKERHYSNGRQYLRSGRLMYDFDGELRRNSPLIESIQVAIAELGKTKPSEFETFVEGNFTCELMLIQRLLCRSLTETDPINVSLAHRYLTSDVRSLFVGGYDDYFLDSRNLISKVAAELDPPQLAELELSIMEWFEDRPEYSEARPEDRRRYTKYDRENRLRLLMAIPADLLSTECKQLLNAEEVALPTVKFRMGSLRKRGLIGFAKGPMSTDQMKLAKDSHILNLFDRLTDDTSWEPIGASQALADLAKEDPERVVSLTRQLSPKDQHVPAYHVMRALGESNYSDDKLFAFIHELVGLGFDSRDFQDAVAWACFQRVGSRAELPDDICDLLKSWLENWKFADTETDQCKKESEEERKRSVVFDLRGGYSFPSGTFGMLSALAYGFIRKEPPKTDEWLDVLNGHVERPDAARTWQVLCHDLRMLWYCESTDANKFLLKLFSKYPTTRDSRFGVRLVLDLRNFLGEQAVEEFCKQYAATDWPMGKQVAGELFGISYLAEDGFAFANDYVHSVMDSEVEAETATLKGIAFAVANLWKEPEIQNSATELFECLAKRNCEKVNTALCEVFLFDRFVPNRYSKRILKSAEQYPDLLRHVSAYHFAEMLELFVTSVPERVLALSNILLDQLEGAKDQEFQRNFDLADAALTSIAMTLQRMNSDLRGEGLDLFERLLRIGFTSTSETVKELDSRPLAIVSRRRRRRRRRV